MVRRMLSDFFLAFCTLAVLCLAFCTLAVLCLACLFILLFRCLLVLPLLIDRHRIFECHCFQVLTLCDSCLRFFGCHFPFSFCLPLRFVLFSFSLGFRNFELPLFLLLLRRYILQGSSNVSELALLFHVKLIQ